MNFGRSAYGGDRVIVRRRIEENKLASIQNAVQKNYHLGSIASWEQSSTKLMKNKQELRNLEQLRKDKLLNLEIRRRKLRSLLAHDEIEYKKEIDNKIETPQERRHRLESKAKELRKKRILRREEFVEKQRLKQFREQCDELRLNVGKNLTMECDRIRKQQMKEKLLHEAHEKNLDKKWLNIWQNELDKKIRRESREYEYKTKLNYDTAKEIRAQIEQLQHERERFKILKHREVEERVKSLNEQQENDKIDKMKKSKELQLKREEERRNYEEFKNKKLEQELLEKKLDKEWIDNIRKQEADKDAKKHEKQHESSADIKGYLKYLNDLKEKEKQNEEMLEKLRQKELENEWVKREMKWKKEDLARKQLLKSVVEGRADQIEYKKVIKVKENNKSTQDTKKILKEIEEYNNLEKKKIEDRLKYNKEIQDFLKKQIDEKKQEKMNGHKEFLAFDVNDNKNNKRYQELLKQETEKDKISLQQGKTQHHYPKTTANWWTY